MLLTALDHSWRFCACCICASLTIQLRHLLLYLLMHPFEVNWTPIEHWTVQACMNITLREYYACYSSRRQGMLLYAVSNNYVEKQIACRNYLYTYRVIGAARQYQEDDIVDIPSADWGSLMGGNHCMICFYIFYK